MLSADLGTAVLLYPHNGTVAAGFMDSFDAMQRYDLTRRLYDSRLAITSGVNICEARNLLVRHFLADTDAEWAWFCDSDMVFADDALHRLLAAAARTDAKIIGGLCCTVNDSGLVLTMFADDDDDITKAALSYNPDDDVVEVAATGTGFLLIHRDVLVAIQDANDGSLWCWFTEGPQVSESGQERWVGEDVTFCLKARELGFSVYVDCSVPIGHFKGNRTWWPSDIEAA